MIDIPVILLVTAMVLMQAGVNLAFLSHLRRRTYMAVSPAAQAIIDSLTSANAALATALANAGGVAAAQAAEDLAGIKAAADPLASAISAAAAAPASSDQGSLV